MTSSTLYNDDTKSKFKFDANIIMPNQFSEKVNTELSKVSNQPSQTLGVENELRRFAMNEYLRKHDTKAIVGTEDIAIDEEQLETHDLLLTNAVTENTVQDEIDKT